MPSLLRKLIWPILLFIVGSVASYLLCPVESLSVENQIIGYPDSDIQAHRLRPWLLGLAFYTPFIAALLYRCCSALDRYTLRIFFNSFFICFSALFIVMFLEDVQDNLADFKESPDMYWLMGKHYLIKLPALLVFILPYALMLGLLWSLGKMSQNQEVVAMIQTGRSVPRIIAPLVGFGLFCALLCVIFNYRWAPYADSQEKNILDQAKGVAISEAKHVAYQNEANTRHWFVGSFPSDHSKGKALQSVTISIANEKNQLVQRIVSDAATWSLEKRQWTLHNPVIFDFEREANSPPKESVTQLTEPLVKDWPETPHQIIKPGLKAPYLGIPGLSSWLANHHDHPLSDKRSYLTHRHYRYAQPFICLITILLAAPLGIVFNRRGVGGGVAVAIFLCAGMIFCSTIFPTLGESGHLPPLIAAWATNILFTTVALILFHRRMTGQPIYQSIKNLFAS